MPHPVVHFEIRSKDPDATRGFFSDLFGWEYSEGGLPGYTYVNTGGQGAIPGGIGPVQGGDDAVVVYRANESGQFAPAAVQHKAHSSDVNSVAWCPSDGGLLASAGDDGAIRLWRLL